MVGEVGAGTLVAVERAGASASDVAWEEKWDVEFSRFFNFPSRSSYSFVSLGLKLLPRAKASVGGTWLTASSTAVLSLARSRPGLTPVLRVHVVGRMLEEHFISNLSILWPQVSCTSESPNRGSGVLLFSYINVSNKIEKFAVRFSSPCIVQQFLNAIKGCSSDIADNELPRSDLPGVYSTPSDLVTSYGVQQINGEESSFRKLAAYASELPVSISSGVENKRPQQQLLACDVDVHSPLPPSFTELMNDCSSEPAQGTPAAGGPADQNIEKCMPDSRPNAVSVDEVLHAVGQQVLVGNVDLRSQIEKYMSDASFNDMLAKIEMVIDELGGDLSL